jgi:hypothetical protein
MAAGADNATEAAIFKSPPLHATIDRWRAGIAKWRDPSGGQLVNLIAR